jgi:small subunit ribosomal protein S2
MMPSLSISARELLTSGVHYGHKVSRWNPKMRPYIFTERHGIHVIDLGQTIKLLDEAENFARDIGQRGGRVVFVGTKKQAQDAIRNEATRSGMPFVDRRWLGGTLTNFVTIRSRLRYLRDLEQRVHSPEFSFLPKQEQVRTERELQKLQESLGGLRDLTTLPAAVFIVDPKREAIAVAEARRLGIPVIAMVDTNCDPDTVDYVIPANDDAIRSVRLIASRLAEALIEGQTERESAMYSEPAVDQAADDARYNLDEYQAGENPSQGEAGAATRP